MSYNTRFQAQAKQQAQQQAQAQQAQQAKQVNPFHVRHQHATRFEYKRIRDLVKQRDCTVIAALLHKVNAATGFLDRLLPLIDMFTYLREHQMLLRVKTFNDTLWKKMVEIEIECVAKLVPINNIQSYNEFLKHRDMYKRCDKLVHIMNDLRPFLRTY
jgi:hypothetical protein